jgi:hypothetical protein
LHLPRPNTWPLNIQRLGQFRAYCPFRSTSPAVWLAYHIPPDKLLACFDNFRMHSNRWHAMAHFDLKEFDGSPNSRPSASIQTKSVPCNNRFGKSETQRHHLSLGPLRPLSPAHTADRRERTACDCSAIARGRPRYPFSSASSPSAIAHARNARAAPRALASSDIFSRRRTRRSRLNGDRGSTYVRANLAASSRVRTVTTRVRRRGGLNTNSVMPWKLARHNRSSGMTRPDARMILRVAERSQLKPPASAMLNHRHPAWGGPS